MKFERYSFSGFLKKNLSDNGYVRPTDIQYKSIPPILKGEDLLAIAQTGTGKTAAFAIPIIEKLSRIRPEHYTPDILCLVMVPTRELAIQIYEVFEKLIPHTDLRAACITGGVEQTEQIEKLKKGVHILVATPGRMFDLIYQKHIKITKVEILVLDEADQMLDLGFIKDIQDVKKFLPKQHQTLFFSATINEHIKDLAYSLVKNPIRIQLSPKDPVSKNVTHSVAFISLDDKRFFLERLVKENPDAKILVFVRTQVRAERVHQAMARVNIESLTLHGGKDQKDRNSVMHDFKTNKAKLLIATDVSARGIDIQGINYVVNYDIPDVAENYVHRVGRTGRGQAKGFAVSFCSIEEKELLDQIEQFIGNEIKIIEVKADEYEKTLDFTEDSKNDWKSLMKEAEKNVFIPKKRKKK